MLLLLQRVAHVGFPVEDPVLLWRLLQLHLVLAALLTTISRCAGQLVNLSVVFPHQHHVLALVTRRLQGRLLLNDLPRLLLVRSLLNLLQVQLLWVVGHEGLQSLESIQVRERAEDVALPKELEIEQCWSLSCRSGSFLRRCLAKVPPLL